MKTILIPTDFSPSAHNAARYAFSLFGDDKSTRFILANTYDLVYSSPEVIVSVDEMMKEDSFKGLQKELEKLRALPEAAGLDIQTISIKGPTAMEIDKLAHKLSIDFIVMGTLGASGIKEVLMGSNTATTIKKVNCPVIAVPNEVGYHRPSKIALATDYKALYNTEELEPLRQLALRFKSEVMLLNVLKPGEITEVNQAVEGLRLKSYFGEVHVDYVFVENEDIETGINNYLESNECHLLVAIERKLGFIEGLFHKSISKKLAFHTHIPLLVLHTKSS